MNATPLPIIGVELGSRMEMTALSVTERVYIPVGEVFTKVAYCTATFGEGRHELR